MIKAQQRVRIEVLAATAAAALALAACGGSAKTSTSGASTGGASQSSAASNPAQVAGAAAARFKAVLTGENHDPVATKHWHYTVRVTSPAGRPMSGTVETEFSFGGQVVGRESPPSHALKQGQLKDFVEWPKQAIGQPLALQVVVHTSAGSQTLDWPVTVRP